MGLFDNNIHLNGAGTTYQSFLRLADEAEQKGGKIGDRTVRLVRAGDGLATTTFSGTKGERVTQIGGARKAFLDAIAKEFGYAARSIAEKTLGAADGEPVPLTARTIRAVNQALGDTGALAADSALVREFKTDFDLEVAGAELSLGSRMGDSGCKLDRGRIQAEALRLLQGRPREAEGQESCPGRVPGGLRQGALLPRQDLRHSPDRDPDDDGEQQERRLRPLWRAALRRLRRQQGEGRAEGQRLHDVEDQALGSHHPLRSGRQRPGRAAENRRQNRLPVRRGGLRAEELFRFITETNAAITDADERKAIHGSEEYSSFMSMATDLLFSLHPDIAGGVRGLKAGARDRLFDEAGTLTTDKSREIQQQRRDGLDLAQAQALALGAKHWSSANACLLQLQHELQA